MHPLDRTWLRRILTALGYGSLLSLACGGIAVDGELDPQAMGGSDMGGSDMGSRGMGGSSTGGSGGGQATGGSGARTGFGGAAGSVSGGGGGSGGSGGGGDGGGGGGAGGVSNAGAAGFSGAAGFAGTAGSTGAAGSATMAEPSVCVNLDFGLAGLPSQAFPAEDALARDICGADFDNSFVYQAICLPAPGNGQSCSSFYPENLISLLYECGLQGSANFVCGPGGPLPGSPGCIGNECCYVLGGNCPGQR